eukprot:766900-Hanusia_phi.AAC.7
MICFLSGYPVQHRFLGRIVDVTFTANNLSIPGQGPAVRNFQVDSERDSEVARAAGVHGPAAGGLSPRPLSAQGPGPGLGIEDPGDS